MTAVTGSPRPSTFRTRSRRSHLDAFFESVEMMISSKRPLCTVSCTEVNGSAPPIRPSTGPPAARRSSGTAFSSVQSDLFTVADVGDQQRELARPPLSPPAHLLQKSWGGGGSVGDHEDARLRRFHLGSSSNVSKRGTDDPLSQRNVRNSRRPSRAMASQAISRL